MAIVSPEEEEEIFYRGLVPEGNSVLFVSQELIKCVWFAYAYILGHMFFLCNNQIHIIHRIFTTEAEHGDIRMALDGTFKAVPHIPGAKQILTIMAIFDRKVSIHSIGM